jgi:hypothetical protein
MQFQHAEADQFEQAADIVDVHAGGGPAVFRCRFEAVHRRIPAGLWMALEETFAGQSVRTAQQRQRPSRDVGKQLRATRR